MSNLEIEFWFDFRSGYAYFAAATIDDVAKRHGCSVTWRPYMLEVALKQTGSRGLSSTPMKGDYARRDWARISRQTGLAFRPPLNHPVISLPVIRAYYWIEANFPNVAQEFAKSAFRAYYAETKDLTVPGNIAVLGANLGVPKADLKAVVTSETMKTKVRQVSSEAISKGVFGSPFFLVEGEPFWGWDRIPMIEHWLETGGW